MPNLLQCDCFRSVVSDVRVGPAHPALRAHDEDPHAAARARVPARGGPRVLGR